MIPLPVTVLSGFLGAGKSTLLNYILRNRGGHKVAIVVNDMSEINIDAHEVTSSAVLHRTQEKLIELTNGCICCTLREDLLEAVAALANERKYDHLVIESSGISEPLHVAETFSFVHGRHGALSDVAQLDTMITVVDAQRFLSDYRAAETLVQLGRGRDAEDHRTIGKLLAEQVEFADLILVNKCDLVDDSVIEEVTGVVKALNPRAEISRMVRGEIPLAKVLGTRRFDIRQAAQSRGWMMELRGEEVPETEEYGIASSVYRARVPFHPRRFMSFLNGGWSNGRLLRSKGYFWLANEITKIWTLSQAGAEFSYEETGRWWRFISRDLWPDDYRLDHLLRDWDESVGDCKQEIVFIGQTIDFEALFAELDRCLLTTEEVRGGVNEWKNY